MLKSSIFIGFLLAWSPVFPQVTVNNDGTPPHSSAMMDVKSTTRGLLPPRMTYAEINAIPSPAEGLIVFCTDCGQAATGSLVIFQDGGWFSLSAGCLAPGQPLQGSHQAGTTQVTWHWMAVPGAAGYKWNLVNEYATATDMGSALSKTETGLACDQSYTRYAWAYNNCGSSAAVAMTKNTLPCPFLCGSSLTIAHAAGPVAPVSKTVTYGTVNNVPGEPSKCWITRNLGASQQATSVSDPLEASAGWYWQFNRKQGYQHTGSVRTPSAAWINPVADTTGWLPANDPCSIELGAGWRLPTLTEWINVKTSGNWTNWNGPWNSQLKMHGAGYLFNTSGNLMSRGSRGDYWASSLHLPGFGMYLDFHSGYAGTSSSNMSYGYTLRCLKD